MQSPASARLPAVSEPACSHRAAAGGGAPAAAAAAPAAGGAAAAEEKKEEKVEEEEDEVRFLIQSIRAMCTIGVGYAVASPGMRSFLCGRRLGDRLRAAWQCSA